MRVLLRSTIIAALSTPLLLVAPTAAFAAEHEDVTFAFEVTGSSVTNTITNASSTAIGCGTSLAPAPGGVLPPVGEVIQNGQSLYTNGQVEPGTSVQSIDNVPAGSYVVLASCTFTDGDTTTAWISDYPGLEDYVAQLPWVSHTVQQDSTLITVGETSPNPVPVPDLGAIISSGSAN